MRQGRIQISTKWRDRSRRLEQKFSAKCRGESSIVQIQILDLTLLRINLTTFNHTPVRLCQGKPLYINVANEDIRLMRAAQQPMPLLL